MIKLFYILLLGVLHNLYCFEMYHEIIPEEPVIGESFTVKFTLTTTEDVQAKLHFQTLGLDVVSQEQGGVSSRTTFINGQVTQEKSVEYLVHLTPRQVGDVYLQNVQVEINGKRYKYKTVRIYIVKEPSRPRDVFVEAEVSGDEFFQNQSIVVKYYIYSKTQADFMTQKFPEFKNILKRYHDISTRPETVNVKGVLYQRSLVYAVQLFYEKPGVYNIDPISIDVTYYKPSRGASRPQLFGLGSSFGRRVKTSLKSNSPKIKIMQLPVDNVPKSFNGLVGVHDFELQINNSNFVTNQPIEVTMSIRGPGALEKMAAPEVLIHPSIEEFQSRSELNISKNFSAEKKIYYTYIANNSLELEKNSIEMSYFDPEKLEYVIKELPLPPIKIVGPSIQKTLSVKDYSNQEQDLKKENPRSVFTQNQEPNLRPIYALGNFFVYYDREILLVFIGLFIFLIFKYIYPSLKNSYFLRNDQSFWIQHKSGKLSYGEFYSELLKLTGKSNSTDALDVLPLSDEEKEGIKSQIKSTLQGFEKKDNLILKLDPKVIKKIGRYCEKRKSFDSKQSILEL